MGCEPITTTAVAATTAAAAHAGRPVGAGRWRLKSAGDPGRKVGWPVPRGGGRGVEGGEKEEEKGNKREREWMLMSERGGEERKGPVGPRLVVGPCRRWR